MVDIIKEYKIEGDYLRMGLKGFQQGEIGYLSNNFFVGYISDKNSLELPFGPGKVLIGFHFLEEDEIGILKIPISKEFLPISWWLKSENKNSNDGLSESYSGYWLPHHSIFSPAINIFRKFPDMEYLLNLDFDNFRDTYFKQKDFEQIRKLQSNLESPNEGRINFVLEKWE